MERYFKISESELLELIRRDLRFMHLEAAGVDNWYDGGLVQEHFETACQEVDLPTPEDEDWNIYTYEDLAREYLKDYQEVEP